MKHAHERIKKAITVEDIIKRIDGIEKDSPTQFKMFIAHFENVPNETVIGLIDLGYKVYRGNWDIYMVNALIIEW